MKNIPLKIFYVISLIGLVASAVFYYKQRFPAVCVDRADPGTCGVESAIIFYYVTLPITLLSLIITAILYFLAKKKATIGK